MTHGSRESIGRAVLRIELFPEGHLVAPVFVCREGIQGRKIPGADTVPKWQVGQARRITPQVG